jgi:penicillin-binding protein 2
MLHKLKLLFSKKKYRNRTLDPDEVILDAFNLPAFDTAQFEGRVVQPVSARALTLVSVVVCIIIGGFAARALYLQVVRGEEYRTLSEQNRLDQEIIFATRGVVFDRFGRELVWNEEKKEDEEEQLPQRHFFDKEGFSHLLGYVSYPELDSSGKWWRLEYAGLAGIEKRFNTQLAGVNGRILTEVDANGNIQNTQIVETPVSGTDIQLSIDADMQAKLFEAIKIGATRSGFVGGAGGVIDIDTGELLALTSFPEYSSQVLSDGKDRKKIASYSTGRGNPFLNRPLAGEYAPGSIVKPYVALAALQEDVISPYKKILSTGQLVLPNPYNPSQPSIFRDWKAHGWVDMIEAIANSSDVYFYEVGGGFGPQEGLGIEKLAAYAQKFGFGEVSGFDAEGEGVGNVPTPQWKEEVFGSDNPWRIGNTYHTSIGQFGFLVTPLQALRYTAALGNSGTLLTPRILKDEPTQAHRVLVDKKFYTTIHEGMRQATLSGTAVSINIPGIHISGKTGTAEVGTHNEYMNSWVIGFWPSDNPQFAFATVLERAPANTLAGAAPAMRMFFEWLVENEPEYANGTYPEKRAENNNSSGTP